MEKEYGESETVKSPCSAERFHPFNDDDMTTTTTTKKKMYGKKSYTKNCWLTIKAWTHWTWPIVDGFTDGDEVLIYYYMNVR